MYKLQNRRKIIVTILVVLAVLLVLFGAGWYVLKVHTVRTVYVEGNVHYSEDEIKELVMAGPLGNNSLFLSFKYRNKGVENVPFVDAMDVKILAPDTIKIMVYEKALAGYVKYMDTYVYFDKDGYVVENSAVKTVGIPQVTGLTLDYMVLGQPLPIQEEYEDVFGIILDITNLLKKYELLADKIYFQSGSSITLCFGEVKVALGEETDRLEDKIMRLPQMLNKIEGKKGTIQMQNYKEDGNYIFKTE